jgi:uncharacterized protein YbaA (DUF1428 family)
MRKHWVTKANMMKLFISCQISIEFVKVAVMVSSVPIYKSTALEKACKSRSNQEAINSWEYKSRILQGIRNRSEYTTN